jgi:hypothetical protein
MKRLSLALLAVWSLCAAVGPAACGEPTAAPKAAPAHTIVLCAPGYPGNTVQAQPAMDAFARAVEKTAGLPAGTIGAVYHETEGGGIEGLRKPDAAFALTTLPFFLQDGEKAGLAPKLAVVRNGRTSQQWSLIAQKGRVGQAADLDGWELTGPAGYAPGFVQFLLQGWGPLRASTKITFAPAPLGALKRIVDGENLAVLLEPEQVQAIFPKHPFASALEIVTTTKPVVGSVVCAVKGRMDEAPAAKILDALTRLQGSPEGVEALKTLRIERFSALEPKGIEWLQHAQAGGGSLKK